MPSPGRAFIGRAAVLPGRAFAIAASSMRRKVNAPAARPGRPCMQGLQACNRASAQPTAIQSGMACRQGITYKAKYSIIVSIVKYRILYYLIAGMA